MESLVSKNSITMLLLHETFWTVLNSVERGVSQFALFILVGNIVYKKLNFIIYFIVDRKLRWLMFFVILSDFFSCSAGLAIHFVQSTANGFKEYSSHFLKPFLWYVSRSVVVNNISLKTFCSSWRRIYISWFSLPLQKVFSNRLFLSYHWFNAKSYRSIYKPYYGSFYKPLIRALYSNNIWSHSTLLKFFQNLVEWHIFLHHIGDLEYGNQN